MIKAIETVYKGYNFRSRLEARWAIFFDNLGVTWEYEPEGFDLDGVRYLPDFYLPDQNWWIEIKPGSKTITPQEVEKVSLFAKNGKDLILVIGNPYFGDYRLALLFGMDKPSDEVDFALTLGNTVFCRCEWDGGLGVIRLGDKPKEFDRLTMCHDSETGQFHSDTTNPRIMAAYTAARQARFEHGETPKFTRKPKSR